jgi:TFIIF-interacting CTD phosphatase-like protein
MPPAEDTPLNLQKLLPKKSLTNHCIILDLDETLVHTEEDMDLLERLGILEDPACSHLKPDLYILQLDDEGGQDVELWGTHRPNLTLFLLFCLTYFQVVAVWSAGQSDYVHDLVKRLFAPLRPPDIIFTFDDCELNKDGDWIKPLSKMFKSPQNAGRMTYENTFILDDRLYTFDKNPDNGLLIPAYSPASKAEIECDDESLEQLKHWFLQPRVRFAKDVRTLPKRDIFSKSLQSYVQDNHVQYAL